jgi:site-specific recombinase XerD
MDYIETRPPVTATVIEDLIARLESVKTSNIDGVVLSNLVRLCNECGLKKSELIDLSVGDVAKAGGVGNAMQIGGTEVSLPSQAMQVLQDHIDYLKKNRYRLFPTDPLFPTKKRTRYSEKTLDNHLKEA